MSDKTVNSGDGSLSTGYSAMKHSPYFQLAKEQDEDGLLQHSLSEEMLFYLQSALGQVDLLSLSKLKDLSDDGVTFVYNFTPIYPIIDQEFHVEVQWMDSHIKYMNICPFVPCEDIFDIVKEDNDIHFLHREVPNRIIAYSLRSHELELLSAELNVNFEQIYQIIVMTLHDGSKAEILCSWDYPTYGILFIKCLQPVKDLGESTLNFIEQYNLTAKKEKWTMRQMIVEVHTFMTNFVFNK